MTPTAEKVMSAAMELPLQMRAFMAEKLIESLDAEGGAGLSTAWKKEVRRRCGEIERGDVRLRDAEAVFRKAFAALK